MKIIKRDGVIQEFDRFKIVDAVLAAFKELDGDISDYALEKAGNIADYIAEYCEKYYQEASAKDENPYLDVEAIQNLVEHGLMSLKRKDVAKAYILYRDKRTAERNRNSALIRQVGEKLSASNVQNQNANVDEHSFGGRMGEANDVLTKQYALDYIVSPMAKANHVNNEIYIHDLSHYAVGDHNCLSIPFDDLLAKGFNTRQTDIRPAGSVNTAFQLIAVIFQIQSLNQFGGVAATHLDWTMVPYVRKSFAKHYKDGLNFISNITDIDYEIEYMLANATEYSIDDREYEVYNPEAYQYALKMTEREVHQGTEGMFHNLNTLQSRSGNQLPFSSINFGTCTKTEGRMVSKALLEVSIEGLGKLHKTSIFPCSIFQCMTGVNRAPGDPNYDLFQLALKSTAQRLYPNYANVDWSGNVGYDKNDPRTYFSTMGKRKLQLM